MSTDSGKPQELPIPDKPWEPPYPVREYRDEAERLIMAAFIAVSSLSKIPISVPVYYQAVREARRRGMPLEKYIDESYNQYMERL